MTVAPRPTFERYVGLGDSSTAGIDDPDGAGGYRGWSRRLAEKIRAAQGHLLYANLAVRGLTTAQIRTGQLDVALAMRPNLATLFCGTNDVTGISFDAERVAADIEHMQQTLVASGATVLSFTLPDLTPIMPLARLIAPRIAALNHALLQASRRTGSILVDFTPHAVATDRRLWSEDRIHANTAGHARIAEALAQALSLPGSTATWSEPFPTPLDQTRRQWWSAELRWVRRHLLPWMWQGIVDHSKPESHNSKRSTLEPL
jgi:lysophospholipase L1-like esterase